MPMKPHKGESQSEFMSRCVPEMMGDGKREQDQAVAACMTMWRDKDKQYGDLDVPDPDDDEGRDDFIDRCVEEVLDDNDEASRLDATEACELAWEERSMRARRQNGVLHKTHAETVNGLEFVLSDETPDRMGDVIIAEGWDLTNFKKNPIALFNHRSDFPIGRWIKLAAQKGKLIGKLILAPEGTSPRIDEIRRLIEAGILKAVSVGFKPIESRPRKVNDSYAGEVFTRAELVETSLVSVPANPNALAIAKSLKVSDATLDLVFAKHGIRGRERECRGARGEHAERTRNRKTTNMTTLTQRIKDAEGNLVTLRDQLTEHLKSVDDSNVSDAQLEITSELNRKIAQAQKSLDSLKEAERALGVTSQNNGEGDGEGDGERNNGQNNNLIIGRSAMQTARPFAMPKKKIDPVEYIVRAGTVAMFSKILQKSQDDVRKLIAQQFPHYDDEPTKAYCAYVARAATAPAMTTVTGWAIELVQTVYANFMETLMPKSVYPRLSGMGLSLSFGRAGKISIPTRSRTPTIAGSFVGEGAAIPVRQGAFTAQTLVPKKMAVITTWTREIDEHSVPAIEGLLRQAIQEDTAVSLDSVLIDSNAATGVRPAGLLNGVAALTATAGGGFNALVGDIKQLTGALITSTSGHLRSPAWLMNPQQTNSAGLIPAPNAGVFPFREELSQGKLQGYPVIDSGTVPMGTVILVDAADFVSVGGDAPRFEVSDQATLHEEDTTPLPISATGTPNTVAAPVRSLFQTDSLALRLILPINWTLRRSGVVAWTQNVTW